MESKMITLFIEVKKVKTADGKTFNAYKTPIGKLNMDVKFTKDSGKEPKKSGYFEFDVEDINLNTTKDYPCLWVR